MITVTTPQTSIAPTTSAVWPTDNQKGIQDLGPSAGCVCMAFERSCLYVCRACLEPWHDGLVFEHDGVTNDNSMLPGSVVLSHSPPYDEL
jgi:hypothetical protein